ncbi:hypothetical protein GCM10020369_66500 [Cryptosporangium minutisporangium]|uniref:Uncharacterized protein n=1 Tax=Cryptosporangium minutisporangium TaxID=113569 RepID=A0ABP6T978_9ACTN
MAGYPNTVAATHSAGNDNTSGRHPRAGRAIVEHASWRQKRYAPGGYSLHGRRREEWTQRPRSVSLFDRLPSGALAGARQLRPPGV